MTANLFYGKELAEEILNSLREQILQLKRARVVALTNPQSPECQIYRQIQKKICSKYGFEYSAIEISSEVSRDRVLEMIDNLNRNNRVIAISLHLPVPGGFDADEFFAKIDPLKDAEGMHPYNLGMLMRWADGDDYFPRPCAAGASYEIIKKICPDLCGRVVVIVSHSPLVGKPLSLLLLRSRQRSATVIICHVATVDLGRYTKHADVIITAAGVPDLIKGEMVKKGSIIIDVATIRTNDGKIAGDVNIEEVKQVASWIVPSVGGVGPVTLAIFLKNIVACAQRQRKT